MAAYSSDMKEFSKEIRSRVGWTASGWIPAAKAAGAKYKKFSDRFGDKSGVPCLTCWRESIFRRNQQGRENPKLSAPD
jgi:hypothetical protein